MEEKDRDHCHHRRRNSPTPMKKAQKRPSGTTPFPLNPSPPQPPSSSQRCFGSVRCYQSQMPCPSSILGPVNG
uniref:Uncharacterized protein n=1 Tax=Cucumis melo TaxID=3656 RepID=A0A9I9EF02_CUCME